MLALLDAVNDTTAINRPYTDCPVLSEILGACYRCSSDAGIDPTNNKYAFTGPERAERVSGSAVTIALGSYKRIFVTMSAARTDLGAVLGGWAPATKVRGAAQEAGQADFSIALCIAVLSMFPWGRSADLPTGTMSSTAIQAVA